MKPQDLVIRFAVTCSLALGGAALAVPTASAAAPSCYNDGCYGLDPKATGCAADAFTVASQGVSGDRGMLQIRYSKTCRAFWARYTAPNGPSAYISGALDGYVITGGRVTIWHEGLPSEGQAGFNPIPGGSTWTKMVISDVQACTGVEVVWTKPGSRSYEILKDPWFWGPCVEAMY